MTPETLDLMEERRKAKTDKQRMGQTRAKSAMKQRYDRSTHSVRKWKPTLE